MGGVSHAVAFTLNYVDSGWYHTFAGGTLAQHIPDNLNYVASSEHNNFFVFNLSGVTDTIVGATLKLWLPANPGGIFIDPDPSLTYTLFDVTTPIPILTTMSGIDATLVPIYTDLGSGVQYGSLTVDGG